MAPSIRAVTPVRDGDRIVGTGGARGRYLGTDPASVMSALPSIAAAVGIAMMLALVGSIGVE